MNRLNTLREKKQPDVPRSHIALTTPPHLLIWREAPTQKKNNPPVTAHPTNYLPPQTCTKSPYFFFHPPPALRTERRLLNGLYMCITSHNITRVQVLTIDRPVTSPSTPRFITISLALVGEPTNRIVYPQRPGKPTPLTLR